MFQCHALAKVLSGVCRRKGYILGLGIALLVCPLWGCNDIASEADKGMKDGDERSSPQTVSGGAFTKSKAWGKSPMSSEEVNDAAKYVQERPDFSSFHLLMALRDQAPGAYSAIPDATKARVLCDALAKETYLNDFGYLHPSEPFDGEAARAILAVGRPCLPFLGNLLSNRQKAPLFGSEGATMSEIYDYRRADFAYRYIVLILGLEPTFAPDSPERDGLITDLQRQLKKQ